MDISKVNKVHFSLGKWKYHGSSGSRCRGISYKLYNFKFKSAPNQNCC